MIRGRCGLLRLAAALILGLILGVILALPAMAQDRVRPSALAGAWYPGEPDQLTEYVDGLLDAVSARKPEMPVRALIVPHAGYRYSGATAAEVFALVRGRALKRVIVLAPSHHSGFRGLSIADVDAYETPLGKVPLDGPAVAELRKSDLVDTDPAAHAREHSIEIQLPLLQRALKPGWRLVPILVGQMQSEDYPQAVQLLRPLADEGALIVVSSDFTHFGPRFGYLPFALDGETPERIKALDDGAIKQILAADAAGFLDYQAETGITICGYRPLALLLYMMPAQARVRRIAYATSGELTGTWDNSVSYVGMLVTSPAPFSGDGAARTGVSAQVGEADLALLHDLAALGVEQAVLGPSDERDTRIRELVAALPEHLRAPSGAFVTLKQDGRLRGCIGYIQPRKPLFQAILENGVNAASRDPRFRPVAPDELAGLELEISVLTPPRPIGSAEEFVVGEQGIILHKDGHQAVFLPEVAVEQGWTREDTLTHLALKAGLPADGWREGATFEVFSSAKYAAPYPADGEGRRPLDGPEPAESVPGTSITPLTRESSADGRFRPL